MTRVRVKGIKRYRANGVWYTYHRASGERIEPPHEFGTPAFFAALERAEAKHQNKSAVAGTWGAAVTSYKGSADWAVLKPRTRADYEKVLNWLSGFDDTALASFTTARCYKVRDKAFKEKKRRFANYVGTMLSIILGHAVKMEMGLDTNPAYGLDKIRKPTDAPEANVPWLEEEIAAFLEAAPPHVATPFAVAVHLGMRGEDVVMLPKTAYRNGMLYVRTGKTGIVMPYPVPADLAARLDTMPAHNAIRLFVNSRGKVWTANGFRHQCFDLRNELAAAGKLRKELTLHGLRTTFGQAAAKAGLDERAVADSMGHADTKTTRIYVRDAARAGNLAKAVAVVAKGRKLPQKP